MPERPIRGDDHASAIEDELVLAADGVDVDEPSTGLECAVARYPDAFPRLATVIRRAVDVEDDRGFSRGVRVERRAGSPRVLAHRQSELGAGEAHRTFGGTGNERSLLVEHAVVRELDLVVPRDDLAVRYERGRVVDPLVGPIDEARDDGAAARGLLREVLERREVVVDERRPQHQILRRVLGDRELGEDHDVGAGLGGARGPRRHELHVAVEVADRRVDLPERDAHHRRSA